MKAAVVVFPGSNCDRDMAVALEHVLGQKPARVWYADTSLPQGLDLIALPGGFSYGDYLRSGAMAAHAPIMAEVLAYAKRGGRVLAVCNGFQIATEAGLLPGALMRNQGLNFVCRAVDLRVERNDTPFSSAYQPGETIALPIAHHDGNYSADVQTLARLEDEGRIVFRYLDNPNGSQHNIAGIVNETRTVLGMMPHPERAVDPLHRLTFGKRLFESLLGAK
jgi:phosphoribosylformylglycinamidine synthase subunit PurQ / glutaminase